MSLSIFRAAVFTTALFLPPLAAQAQEVFGTLDATLDGSARSWVLTGQDGDSQSFGLSIAIANMQSFTLWGKPEAESVSPDKDTLLLSFDVMSVGDQTVVLNASVIFLADGWASGWIGSEAEGDQVKVSLTTLEKTDTGLHIAGSFTATTGYAEPLAGATPDPSRPMQIDGSFNATLPEYALTEQ